MANMVERLFPDTSVIIEGLLSRKILAGEIKAEEIVIHEAVVAVLQKQADESKVSAFLGIAELEKLVEIKEKCGFAIRFSGKKPNSGELRYLTLSDVDTLIRELAYEEDGMLYTADAVQARLANIKGVRCRVEKLEDKARALKLEKFFDNVTMSVHLRENALPYAKKGLPGNWQFVAVREQLLTREEVEDISREILEEAKVSKEGFIEIERAGSTIVQLGLFRIVITRPPFSDGWEITAVRPVKKMGLAEYNISEKLQKRLDAQAEGVLIAGSPGMGKSTFASALAEYYAAKEKIVKTVEAPRDLVLSDNITQYAISHGDAQEIHDILLLSRPDYTIFDEMRNTEDFKLFADLRLAGIGFIGVVHATKPVDAIQRFVGRIELGVIPQIVDTVIFIKDGKVAKILSLQMLVKVPSGMSESDLARPIVVVNDFETKRLEYEIYSYGEETVVIPVMDERKNSAVSELARKQIENELRRFSDKVRVEMCSESGCKVFVPEEKIAMIIGKQGKTINEIEQKLGIHIDVEELKPEQEKKTQDSNSAWSGGDGGSRAEGGEQLPYNVKIGKNITFMLEQTQVDKNVTVSVNGDYLLTAKVSKKAQIKIKKNNRIAKIILDALNMGEKVEILGQL
jgi:ATPase